MEQGAKALLKILCSAFLLGGLIIGFHPVYRQAFVATWQGTPTKSPIWQSNIAYYPDITLPESAAAAADTANTETSHDAE